MRWTLLVVGIFLLGFAPAPRQKPAVKPGVVVSKADRHGLVTSLRPVVTRLHPEDPFRVALHWSLKDRPLGHGDVAGTWLRHTTLCSMTFTLTTPGGKYTLKPDNARVRMEPGRWLYHRPTFVLTLTKDGVREEGERKSLWAGRKRPDFSRPGVYRLSVKGSLVRIAEPAIPFVSESVVLEVSRYVRTQAKGQAIACAVMRKQQPAIDLSKATVSLREDDKGNIVVRFRTIREREESNDDWTVLVKSDGKAERPSLRQVKTCEAQGYSPRLNDPWYDRWPEHLPRAK